MRALFLGVCLTVLSTVCGAQAPLCGIGTSPHTVRALPSVSTPLTLAVAYPTEGLTVGSRTIQVYGAFSGPPNTGVSVNGVAALQSFPDFLSHDVSLKPGSNAVAITVTTAAGATKKVTRNVIYDPLLAPDVELRAAFVGDYRPFSLRYLISVRAGADNSIVTRMRADYTSDGAVDTDTTDAATRLTHTYDTYGVKTATVTVDLDDGAPGTAPATVTVTRRAIGEDLDITRLTLCNAYETFRTRLASQQYGSAMEIFSADARPTYRGFIEGLGPNGATVAAAFGEIVDGTIGISMAELILARPVRGSPGTFNSYTIQFVRDPDGVWRIASM